LRAGAVVGEAGLFSDQPRMANVEAMTACALWALRGVRYDELAVRSPVLALEVARAVAALMGQRMRANIERGNAIS
jgi:CRP/FNR family transcriptional regulator, cyclic AMP receptor protein